MLYQERYSSAYLSQAQSSLVQWGLDGKLRTILDTILIHRGIKSLNKQAVLAYLHEALWRANEEPRRKQVIEASRYIERNWDGIENGVKHPGVGCSAEGHVSHILAARLSNRPMAWSLQGAENMAAMRVAVANGESIRKQYLAMQASILFPVEIKEAVQEKLKRLPKRKLRSEERRVGK